MISGWLREQRGCEKGRDGDAAVRIDLAELATMVKGIHGIDSSERAEPHLLDLAYDRNLPLVATNPTCLPSRIPRGHDVMLCIADAPMSRRPIAAQLARCLDEAAAEMKRLFEDLPEALPTRWSWPSAAR
eukprot:tig00001467_g8753.t1